MNKLLILALPLMFLFTGKVYAEDVKDKVDTSQNTVNTEVKGGCMILSVKTEDNKTIQATGQCPGKEAVTVTNEGTVHTVVDGQPVDIKGSN